MKPYFDTPALQRRLAGVAASWLGTPFADHANVKGAGVDCVHLAGSIYIESGALKKFDPPPYAMDGGYHQKSSKVTQWVEQSGRFAKLPLVAGQAMQPGDLLCFRIGAVEHHVGVFLANQNFIAAHRRYGVIISPISDSTYWRMLSALYRPLAWPEGTI